MKKIYLALIQLMIKDAESLVLFVSLNWELYTKYKLLMLRVKEYFTRLILYPVGQYLVRMSSRVRGMVKVHMRRPEMAKLVMKMF